MKYLYKNEDDFIVERRLGRTRYYCDVLKSAIEKYDEETEHYESSLWSS